MTRDDIIRMAREAGFRAGHIELYHFFHQNIASMLRRCYESRCCLSNTFRLPSSPETRMDTRALREYWTAYSPTTDCKRRCCFNSLSRRVKVGVSHSSLLVHTFTKGSYCPILSTLWSEVRS